MKRKSEEMKKGRKEGRKGLRNEEMKEGKLIGEASGYGDVSMIG